MLKKAIYISLIIIGCFCLSESAYACQEHATQHKEHNSKQASCCEDHSGSAESSHNCSVLNCMSICHSSYPFQPNTFSFDHLPVDLKNGNITVYMYSLYISQATAIWAPPKIK